MTKRLSPAAVVALKEALCAVYWYKADLRSFLQQCVSRPALLANLNWDNYKRQVVTDLVDHLTSDEVCAITTFRHLEQLDGGAEKAERARNAVAQLKRLVEPHEQAQKENDDLTERQQRAAAKLKANAAVRQKLEEIRARYMALVASANAQGRGFELERRPFAIRVSRSTAHFRSRTLTICLRRDGSRSPPLRQPSTRSLRRSVVSLRTHWASSCR